MVLQPLANDALGIESLADYNLRKFCASMRTGRMVAFVGAYANIALGYDSWSDFLSKYMHIARRVTAVPPTVRLPIEPLPDVTTFLDTYLVDTLMQSPDLPESAGKLDKLINDARHKIYLNVINNLFSLKDQSPREVSSSTAWQLVNSLGINRIITTNYDLEFEWQLMLTSAEKDGAADPHKRQQIFDTFLDREGNSPRLIQRNHDDADGKGGLGARDSGMMSRRLSSGRFVTSDVFSRDRTDRLFEFSLGSVDQDAHILHLHGRALPEDADSLVITRTDYDRLYRRDSIGKRPFEHALSTLYAGNPIIFVGSGMTEEVLTRTLEQFAANGDHINRPPAFVLWTPLAKIHNTARNAAKAFAADPGKAREFEYLRQDYYRRFGVLTLFDTDPSLQSAVAAIKQNGPRDRLSLAVEALATLVSNRNKSPKWTTLEMRSAQSRIDLDNQAQPINERHDVWRSTKGDGTASPWRRLLSGGAPAIIGPDAPQWKDWDQSDRTLLEPLFSGPIIKTFIDTPGTGHGFLAKFLGHVFCDVMGTTKNAPHSATCVINASFIWEIESAFSLVSGLFDSKTAHTDGISRNRALRKWIELSRKQSSEANAHGLRPGLASRGMKRISIVINGADRFFETSGYPLSAELDAMIRFVHTLQSQRLIYKPGGGVGTLNDWTIATGYAAPLSLILLGTERVRRYLAGIGLKPETDSQPQADYRDFTHREFAIGRDWLEKFKTQQGALPAQPRHYPTANGQSTFLDTAVKALRPSDGYRIAHQALINFSGDRRQGAVRRTVLSTILRSSVVSELLDKRGLRHLAPLAHDLLTTLSFFGSPTELEVLQLTPRISARLDELGATSADCKATLDLLVDHYLVFKFKNFAEMPAGRYQRYGLHSAVMQQLREEYGMPLSDAKLSASFNIALYASQPIDDYSPDNDMHVELAGMAEAMIANAVATARKSRPAKLQVATAVSCLRGALSLLRSYFTTASLVTSEPKSLAFEGRDAPLQEQAHRLARIAESALELARVCSVHKLPPALYPDDLVWLYNELGVVRLEQGDLYKARLALRTADQINREQVEFGDHGHNWRRIQLNLVHVDIERGALVTAESRMLSIETSLCEYVDDLLVKKDAFGETILSRIVSDYGDHSTPKPRMVDPNYPADAILIGGMLIAYRAMIDYLRGELTRAEQAFSWSQTIFRNIDERRAFALFASRYGSLLNSLNRPEDAQTVWDEGIAAADATRQVDLAISAKLDRAESRVTNATADQLNLVTRQVRLGLHYGQVNRMHRIHMEARKAMALLRYKSGDYDGALEQVSAALAIAARYGFTLRKISLRVLLGQIMVMRGDVRTGRALIRQSIRFAERIGYQRSVQLGQNVLIRDAFE